MCIRDVRRCTCTVQNCLYLQLTKEISLRKRKYFTVSCTRYYHRRQHRHTVTLITTATFNKSFNLRFTLRVYLVPSSPRNCGRSGGGPGNGMRGYDWKQWACDGNDAMSLHLVGVRTSQCGVMRLGGRVAVKMVCCCRSLQGIERENAMRRR